MAAPVLFLLTVVVYPLVYAVGMSLQYYRLGGFAGLHNYALAFEDSLLGDSLRATLEYVVLTMGIECVLGLALAVAVQRTVRSVAGRTLV
jgi:multiple sugar transport system permease protein